MASDASTFLESVNIPVTGHILQTRLVTLWSSVLSLVIHVNSASRR
jgi:hypothetical protein